MSTPAAAPHTIACIQARMGSRRLPGKVLADLGGVPMLSHVIRRTRGAALVDSVAVLTTDSPTDDIIAEFCRVSGVPVVRGSEEDVLARYHLAATRLGAEVIVRITADCPFIDSAVIDRVIAVFHSGEFDYVSNTVPPTYPDGLDVEAFSAPALELAVRSAKLASEREHVTPFMRSRPDLFRCGNVSHDEDLSHLRWTVDEPQDLEFARAAGALIDFADVPFRHLIAVVRAHPELRTLNGGIGRDEGYRRSLLADQRVHLGLHEPR